VPTISASEIAGRIARAATEIKAADAVVIIGAGISRGPGFPMIVGLRPLLWQALDNDIPAREILAARLGVGDTDAKILIGDDNERANAGFAVMAERAAARHAFQHAFARLDHDRSYAPSPAHDALAELVHRGAIALVISLNWDTVLERAHERRYGRRLVPGFDPVAKPHGEVASRLCWKSADGAGSPALVG
jgi:NAD-dependent SIR2 family protein deacetylase